MSTWMQPRLALYAGHGVVDGRDFRAGSGVPHFHRGPAADALKDSSRGSTEGKERSWIRSALVVSEIGFACVLLVGAGLLMRSFLRVLDVNMGFQPERAMSVRVDPDSRYRTTGAAERVF